MIANTYFLFGIIVIFVLVKQGQSLRCYDCNSYVDSNCDSDNILEKYNKKCENDSYVLCRKIKQVIDFEVNDLKPNVRIIRSCGMTQDDPNKCYQRSGFGGRQIVCACNNGDLCNSSSINYVSVELFLGALLLVKISVYN